MLFKKCNYLKKPRKRQETTGWEKTPVNYGFPVIFAGAALVFHEIFFPESSTAMALFWQWEPTVQVMWRVLSEHLFRQNGRQNRA